jgi:hypothetical protein
MWGNRTGLAEIKDIAQQPSALPVLVAIGFVVMVTVVIMIAVAVGVGAVLLAPFKILIRSGGLNYGRGSLDNLVQLSSVKPHAAAFGAVVDFDSLTIRHLQFD